MDLEAPPLLFRDLFEKREQQVLPRPDDPGFKALAAEYRPWRKARHVAAQNGMDPRAAWATLKTSRLMAWRWLELSQARGGPFGICLGPHLLARLHQIDRATGGGGPAALDSPDGVLADESSRARLRIRTLMDEAAESSIIEGAATTRKQAVDLLRSGRSPRTKADRMVVNNYLAMQQIKRWLGKPLTVDLLQELQTILTEGTLDEPDAAGRFRRADESIRVVDTRDDATVYVPPPAEGLLSRMKQVCEFANRAHEGPDFLHPIIKASILHFMIGYEHPFVDGNGRTARAVFYWYALRHGYGVFEYTAISELIRKGYARYPQAYLDTELDDGDLTYFVLYKLDIIGQALERLSEHLRNEETKINRSQALLKLARDLNLRQRLLLEHGLRHPGTHYTVKSHMNSNGIVTNTSRADLDDLVRRRLMTTTKRAREVIYLVVPGLAERLARKNA